MKIPSNVSNSTISLFDNSYGVMAGKINKEEDYSTLQNNPVQVTISEEGKEKFRNDFAENVEKENNKYQEQSESLKEAKVLTSHVNVLLGKIQSKSVGTLTADKQARAIFEAYATEYDNIVKGYQDGTRECYVIDNDSETGYRKLTKEEDLKALDDAYREICEGFENWVRNAQEAEDIVERDYIKRLQYMRTSQNRGNKIKDLEESVQGSLAEIERSRKGRIGMPENVSEKLKQAGQKFLSQYQAVSTVDAQAFNKMLLNIIIW